MTQSAMREEPLVLSADADPLNDLFDRPGEESRAHSANTTTRPVQRSSSGLNALFVAALASLVWIAAVAAFCWARYSLPDNPGDAIDVVGTRIGTDDWMFIAAAILGPLLLIWIIAWLMRRTAELKHQSQNLANAALRLTQVAQTAEATGRPTALGAIGEVTGDTPRHLRREVERATHAISALHSQMRAIEEALSTQASNIDDVAERAEKRAKYIATTLRAEREALERVTGNQGSAAPAESASLGAVGTGVAAAGMAGIGAAVTAGLDRDVDLEPSADVTDFALDEVRVEAAADSDAADDMIADAQGLVPDEGSTSPTEADFIADEEDTVEGVAALRTRLAEAKANAQWNRPTLTDEERAAISNRTATADPFDESGRDAPDAPTGYHDNDRDGRDTGMGMAAAAVGAGAAALAGATPSATALDHEPEEYEALDVDMLDDSDDAPFKLERRHMIDWQKFTRAANFPESEEDIETLDALYDVLTDPEAASLLQCAEDTLASMADIDLYMEDYAPRLVPVVTWRNHLDGSGGEKIDGINAPVEQSRIRAKLNTDKGFEHLCAKFMDRYEAMGRRLLNETDNEQLIVDLSNTRTGRAYMMISEAAGRLSS